LDFVEAAAASHGVDAIGIAGDILHKDTLAYASGSYSPMESVTSRFYRWSKRWPILVIPGNHDMRNNRLDLLAQTPFGVLLAAKILTPVWERPHVSKDGSWVGGVPYRVTEEKVKEWASMQGPGVLLAHCYASMTGGDYFGETVFSYPMLGNWVPEAVAFCFGHDHRDLGVETLGNQSFIQLGSLLRGTRADDQMLRQPKIAVVETILPQPLFDQPATCKVTVIPVPIEAPELVFTEKKAQVEEASAAIDQYVAELATIQQAVDPTIALERLSDVPMQVKQMATAYLARAVEGR
jgi:hypothetical protein